MGNNGFRDVLNHFVLKGAYVLAAYVVQKALSSAISLKRRTPVSGAEVPKRLAKAGPRYKVFHHPEQEYTASNPRWLSDAAKYDAVSLATDLTWQCPLLIEFRAKVAHGNFRVEFGKQARKQLFCLDPDAVYLNHGSYGAAFRLALEVQAWYQQQLEAQPVRFMETIALKALVAAVADAANFLGAQGADVVPVTNATSAINAVLRSVRLRRGDWVLQFNTTYPAVKSTLARVASAAGASVLEVQLGLEEMLQPSSVIAALQVALATGGRRIKLAVLDHVVSFPPIILPVREMAAMCRQVGAQVLVDGAHAAGNLPGLSIPSLGVDYYVTNLHKWCCTPKGVALLWSAPGRQGQLKPLVTSHGYGLGFRGEFLWQGTQDTSAWLAAPAALAMLRALDPLRVAQHNGQLVAEAAALLRRAWDVETAVIGGDGAAAAASNGASRQAAPSSSSVGVLLPGMAVVQLPPELAGYSATAADAARLNQALRSQHQLEVPVIAAMGKLWVRISAQLYNTLEDYQILARAVSGLRQQQPPQQQGQQEPSRQQQVQVQPAAQDQEP